MKKPLLIAAGVFSAPAVLVAAMILGGTPQGSGEVQAGAAPGVCVVPAANQQVPASEARDRNWTTVIERGIAKKVPGRGITIAIAVTLVESTGLNYASRKVPESLRYPNDGVVPGDHLSINLFQQQVGMGWFDTVQNGMKVPVAADSFYDHLTAVNGWQVMSFGGAAQAVQRSAFPSRYAKREAEAVGIYNRLVKAASPVVPASDVTAPNVDECKQETSGGAAVISGRWANPLKPTPYVLTSHMGWRTLRGVPNYHKGQDLAVPIGSHGLSPCDGVVARAEWDTYGGGYQMNVDCGGDILIKLMHNIGFKAKKGDKVTAGQWVTITGNEGNSTGPHLHVQVEKAGTLIDPMDFFRDRGVPL